MIPTNKAKTKGCSPVSSNCVVWQGPDLPCIDLCKGDTISDVVYKMAVELCELKAMFDLTDYDLECFSLNPNTATIKDLLQTIITRVCTTNGLDPQNPEVQNCPENCIVSIADCFYFQNPQGDTITSMSLLDYVTAIGNRICNILLEIGIIQAQIQTLLNVQNEQQESLEGIPQVYPRRDEFQYQVNPLTDGEGDSYFITEATRQIENSLLETQQALGTATQLFQSMLFSGNITNEDRMSGIGNMSTYTGWVNQIQNLSDNNKNVWLSIHDLRDAVQYLKDNAIARSCNDLYLNFRATLQQTMSSTTITIFVDGSVGFNNEWIEVNNNTIIEITDANGNSSSSNIQLLNLLYNPNGLQLDITNTSIDPTLNITVKAFTNFQNTVSNIVCDRHYTDIIVASPVCPNVTITAYQNSVNYQFTTTSGYNYIVNVYLGNNNNPVATQIINNPGAVILQTLLNLIPNTNYELEVVVVDSVQNQTSCTRIPFTTLINSCSPPTNASVNLTI